MDNYMYIFLTSLTLLFTALVVYWILHAKTERLSRLAKEEASRKREDERREIIKAENWKTIYSNSKNWTKTVPDPDYDKYDTYQNKFLTERYGWHVTVKYSDVLKTYEITHSCDSNDDHQKMVYAKEYEKAISMTNGSNVIIKG